MKTKAQRRKLSETWREFIFEDLKNSKKLKVDLSEKDPLEFFPESSVSSITKATSLLIRSNGVVKTSRATGVPRSSLYSVMSDDSNPTIDTISKILNASGYQLAIVPINEIK